MAYTIAKFKKPIVSDMTVKKTENGFSFTINDHCRIDASIATDSTGSLEFVTVLISWGEFIGSIKTICFDKSKLMWIISDDLVSGRLVSNKSKQDILQEYNGCIGICSVFSYTPPPRL